jgi:NADPH2 dehydrogenase
MGMEDPLPTFAAFVERIRDAHPNFAYIHVIEKLERPDMDPVNAHDANSAGPNDVLRKIWGERPYIAAGGFHRVSANSTVEKYGGLIAFGRHFIANVSCAYRLTRWRQFSRFTPAQPDLPLRLKEGIELTPYNRATFYLPETATGYIDYPFAKEVAPLQA